MKTIIVLLFCVSMCWFAEAWRQQQIMIVTAISRKLLQTSDLFSYFYFQKLVKSINGLIDAKSRSFLEASCWPLDLEKSGLKIWKSWSAQKQPIEKQNSSSFVPLVNRTQQFFGIVRTLNESFKVVSSNRFKKRAQSALFSRYLLNLVAEVHFPLNCAALYNESFPDGDQGARKLNIYVEYGNQTKQMSLRYFWEQYIVPFVQESLPERPVAEEQLNKYYGNAADFFINKYGQQAQKQISQKNPAVWAQQSLQIARKQIYSYFNSTDTLKMNQKQGEAYALNAKQILGQRITIAGFRLASTISRLYRSNLKPQRLNEKIVQLRYRKSKKNKSKK